jgi:hypothetical protein
MSGQWEVGSGQWEVGSGKWEVGSGKWAVGKKERKKERKKKDLVSIFMFCNCELQDEHSTSSMSI